MFAAIVIFVFKYLNVIFKVITGWRFALKEKKILRQNRVPLEDLLIINDYLA